DVVEKYLPQADVEGRFEERKLAVMNLTDEPIAVWVQAHTRSGGRGPWTWSPAGPGPGAKAERFVVGPKRVELLEHPGGGAARRAGRPVGRGRGRPAVPLVATQDRRQGARPGRERRLPRVQDRPSGVRAVSAGRGRQSRAGQAGRRRPDGDDPPDPQSGPGRR